MSGIGSSLTKAEDGTGLVNRTALAQLAGVVKHLTRAEFDAAVAAERARISSNSTGIYKAGEEFAIVGEVGRRLWTIGTGGSDAANAAASHAKLVRLPDGSTVTLAADANTVIEVSAFPTGGVDGNVAFNPASKVSYTRASGTWTSNAEVTLTSSRALLASDLGKTLLVNSSSTVTLDNSGAIGYIGAPPIIIRRVGSGAVAYTASANLVDPGPFTSTLPQGLSTALLATAAGVLTVQG